MVLTQKYFDGRVPAQGSLTDYDKETLKEFADVKAEVEKLLDVFKFRDAQKEAMNLARIGNKYLADTEPWKLAKTDMERVGTIRRFYPQHFPATGCQPCHRVRPILAVQLGKTPQNAEHGYFRMV